MGLYVLFKKKPIVLNNKWYLGFMFLCFIPQIISASYSIASRGFSLLDLILPLMYVVLFVMLCIIIKGYIVYGVNGNDLENKLFKVLDEKGYTYEIKISQITIEDLNLDISVGIQEWTGSAHIKGKGKFDKKALSQIVNELKKQDLTSNRIQPIFSIIIGALMALMGVVLLFRLHLNF